MRPDTEANAPASSAGDPQVRTGANLSRLLEYPPSPGVELDAMTSFSGQAYHLPKPPAREETARQSAGPRMAQEGAACPQFTGNFCSVRGFAFSGRCRAGGCFHNVYLLQAESHSVENKAARRVPSGRSLARPGSSGWGAQSFLSRSTHDCSLQKPPNTSACAKGGTRRPSGRVASTQVVVRSRTGARRSARGRSALTLSAALRFRRIVARNETQ